MLLFPSVGVTVVSEFNAPSTAKVQALFNRIHIEFPVQSSNLMGRDFRLLPFYLEVNDTLFNFELFTICYYYFHSHFGKSRQVHIFILIVDLWNRNF